VAEFDLDKLFKSKDEHFIVHRLPLPHLTQAIFFAHYAVIMNKQFTFVGGGWREDKYGGSQPFQSHIMKTDFKYIPPKYKRMYKYGSYVFTNTSDETFEIKKIQRFEVGKTTAQELNDLVKKSTFDYSYRAFLKFLEG